MYRIFDRPLSEKRTPRRLKMAEFLKSKNVEIDTFVVAYQRAITTCRYFAEILKMIILEKVEKNCIMLRL